MRFYSTSYQDTLDLPLRTFWMMSNNINRISAEEDIRNLSVATGSQSEKGFKQVSEALKEEMGEIFKRSEESEVMESLSKLRKLAG